MLREAVDSVFKTNDTAYGPCFRRDDVLLPTAAAAYRYCASANIPPAKECQAGVTLIGQFRSFTATSAAPP